MFKCYRWILNECMFWDWVLWLIILGLLMRGIVKILWLVRFFWMWCSLILLIILSKDFIYIGLNIFIDILINVSSK